MAALIAHQNSARPTEPTTQDIAVVVCGGCDPFAEYEQIKSACTRLGLPYHVFAGNDMISEFPEQIAHGVSLHPDKLGMWMSVRLAKGLTLPHRIWAHRNYPNVTDWTRDWDGSTGLFCVKVARELGFTHIVLCGVPMTKEGGHFLRGVPWHDYNGFRRGWTDRLPALMPYIRSYSGWTRETFTEPTDEWLTTAIQDEDRYPSPQHGLKA